MAEYVPIDYSSRDYASVRADLIAAIPSYLPEWTNRSETDFGITLIELFAYQADMLSYYTDRIANEAFITTAVQRASVLSLAAMLDYRPAGLGAARAALSFGISANAPGFTVTIPARTQVSTRGELGADPVIFETDVAVTIAKGATGSVAATEGRSVSEDATNPVGISNGFADQAFTLYHTSVIDGSLTVYVDEDGTGPAARLPWRFVDHLIDGSSDERVYSTFTNEDGVVYILFGDNVNGRIPVTGSVITAEYRTGVGQRGNVGAHSLTEIVSTIVGVDSVTNPNNAVGGADVESIESIRRRAPRSLTTLDRAVTLADYETLALKVSGVALAKAHAGVYTSVLLYIAPSGGGAPPASLKNNVQNYLVDKKMAGTTITVGEPTYTPVNIIVSPLHVLPQYNRSQTETAVRNRLGALFALSEVDFGFRVTLSAVYKAINEIEGVDYAVLFALHVGVTASLGDVLLEPHQIPVLGNLSIASSGGLIGS